jgi:hypothetical protein
MFGRLGDASEERHRELAVVGHLPRRDLPGPAARHRERVRDIPIDDLSPEKFQHCSSRIAYPSAQDGAYRPLVRGHEKESNRHFLPGNDPDADHLAVTWDDVGARARYPFSSSGEMAETRRSI